MPTTRTRRGGPSWRAREILKLCVAVGGCLTGEHGVGIEKRDLMEVQFSPADLAVQMRIKSVFDPQWLLNPGKVFPLDALEAPSARPRPGGLRRCDLSDLQRPGADWELQFVIAGCAEKRLPIEIVGSGSKRAVGRPVDGAVTITTASLRGISLYEPNELVMSARAGTPLSQIEAELAARGQMLPFEPIDWPRHRRPAGHADHRRRCSPPTCRAPGASSTAPRATTCSASRASTAAPSCSRPAAA